MLGIVGVAKALSDANRVRAMMMLVAGELCVCQIIEMLGLAPSTVSKHMSILRQAGLVRARKQGRWMYYSLAGDDAPARVRQAIDWVVSNTAGDAAIRGDRKRLQRLITMDKVELCRMQRG